MNEYQEKLELAFGLHEAGRLQECADVLSNVYKKIPATDLKTLVLAGSLFRESKEFSMAIYCFQQALHASPLSPRASLGLFHSLWNSENYDQALDELERFYSASKEFDDLQSLMADGEHDRLLAEMSDAYFENTQYAPEDPFILLKELRRSFQD